MRSFLRTEPQINQNIQVLFRILKFLSRFWFVFVKKLQKLWYKSSKKRPDGRSENSGKVYVQSRLGPPTLAVHIPYRLASPSSRTLMQFRNGPLRVVISNNYRTSVVYK